MESALTPVHPEGTVYGQVLEASVPLRYSTTEAEYEAIRGRAAVLDLGGSRLIQVRGSASGDFLQRVLARDVEYLTSERSTTSLILDDAGAIVDSVVVWGREDGAILESSCGAGTRLLEYLASQNSDEVEIVDRSDELTVIAVEGPYSWGVIGRLIDSELAALPLDSVVDTQWDGSDILFGRTGSSGEYGYKVIAAHEVAKKLWTQACEHAVPAGQEVLELAMLEVRQPVVRHEAPEGTGVLEVGAGWLVDITKESFVGRDAVLAAFAEQSGPRTIGFRGGEAVPAKGTRVSAGGQDIGEVVHAVYSVGLGAALGLARVDSDLAAAGLNLTAGDADIETLTSPYVSPKSWSIPIV
ncbi:glycine cleavage T C-terminal barrel domain-containing protein [Actinoalloteichus hymeniacidonis]|uniref:Glycine cleavage system T protein (Aminomethyltransferase) n=1 Tax=Actinoalloteichus hymeniacidonis TaxID=340345 RepID=A0AAC9MW94_9PSEU|nr:glycine cleavage T C-terminal barrel domain-containing protein [Actinoalloteichus hymeniacidonis]AOS61963.1 glycine cleavage system T protein (aminomethyltransferase) [Actinoalloteichus hymeniacidonis]MBB5910015.1 aminomethyltransferase [Actinoalloteichus hymeniacidonis]